MTSTRRAVSCDLDSANLPRKQRPLPDSASRGTGKTASSTLSSSLPSFSAAACPLSTNSLWKGQFDWAGACVARPDDSEDSDPEEEESVAKEQVAGQGSFSSTCPAWNRSNPSAASLPDATPRPQPTPYLWLSPLTLEEEIVFVHEDDDDDESSGDEHDEDEAVVPHHYRWSERLSQALITPPTPIHPTPLQHLEGTAAVMTAVPLTSSWDYASMPKRVVGPLGQEPAAAIQTDHSDSTDTTKEGSQLDDDDDDDDDNDATDLLPKEDDDDDDDDDTDTDSDESPTEADRHRAPSLRDLKSPPHRRKLRHGRSLWQRALRSLTKPRHGTPRAGKVVDEDEALSPSPGHSRHIQPSPPQGPALARAWYKARCLLSGAGGSSPAQAEGRVEMEEWEGRMEAILQRKKRGKEPFVMGLDTIEEEDEEDHQADPGRHGSSADRRPWAVDLEQPRASSAQVALELGLGSTGVHLVQLADAKAKALDVLSLRHPLSHPDNPDDPLPILPMLHLVDDLWIPHYEWYVLISVFSFFRFLLA